MNVTQVESKSKVEPKPKLKRKPSVERFFGRVIIRYDYDGFFYPGKWSISEITPWRTSLPIGTIQNNHDGRSVVQLDMGIELDVIGHILLPTNGAIAQPNLFVQDFVLVRQMNQHREFWAPGVVVVLPSPVARPALYTVRIYTPSPQQVRLITERKISRNCIL